MNYGVYVMQLTSVVMGNLQYVILGLTLMLLLALGVFININIKLTKLNRRYQKMMRGVEGANIEQLLAKHIDEVRQAVGKVDHLEQEYQRMDAEFRACIQKVGVIRFNAFEDTGSDLSFAVALLDHENNGVVVSSIFGRSESRSYAKPVEDGQSSYFLTTEEKQALDQAMGKKSLP